MAGKIVLVVSREFTQGASVPLHLGLSLRLPGLPHSIVTEFQGIRSRIHWSLKSRSLLNYILVRPGFPHSSVGKESTCNAGDPSSIPGSGRPNGEGIGYSLQNSWASLVVQLVKNLAAMWKIWVYSWVGKIPWRRERLPTPVFWPGEFHGIYSPWGPKELDTTE